MAELVDAHASGACGATLGGSSPLFGTKPGIIKDSAGVVKLVDTQS